MSLWMIGVIKNKSNIIGFRLLDDNTRQVKDVPYNNIMDILKKGLVTIENIEVVKNKLESTNGSLNSYGSIDNKKVQQNCPVVVLSKKEDKFICADIQGRIASISESDLLRIAQTNGIANGKVVNNKVYSKKGNFKTIEQYELKMTKDESNKLVCIGIEPSDYSGDVELTNIEFISMEAFKGSKIRNLKISGKIKAIGECAFINSNIQNLEIKSNNITIMPKAFYNSKLKTVKIQDKSGIVSNCAFEHCLELISLDCNIKQIGVNSFRDCISLSNLKLNASSIKHNAFGGCASLEELKIENATYVGDSAFGGTGVEKLTINKSKISMRSLAGMLNLKIIEINEGVTLNRVTLKFYKDGVVKINKPLTNRSIVWSPFIELYDNAKVKVYMSSKDFMYGEIENHLKDEKNVELINTNEDKSAVENMNEVKLSMLGITKEQMYIDSWKTVFNSIDTNGLKELEYESRYKINNKRTDIPKELKGLISNTEYKPDSTYEAILMTVKRITTDLRDEIGDELFKEDIDIKDYIGIRNIKKEKYYSSTGCQILIVDYIGGREANCRDKKERIKGRVYIFVSNGKVDYMCALDESCIVVGALSNKKTSLPIQYITVGDYWKYGTIHVAGLNYLELQRKDSSLNRDISYYMVKVCIKIEFGNYLIMVHKPTSKMLIVSKSKSRSEPATWLVEMHDLTEPIQTKLKISKSDVYKVVDAIKNKDNLKNEIQKNRQLDPQGIYKAKDLVEHVKKNNMKDIKDLDSTVVLNLENLVCLKAIKLTPAIEKGLETKEIIEIKDRLILKFAIYKKKRSILLVIDKDTHVLQKAYQEDGLNKIGKSISLKYCILDELRGLTDASMGNTKYKNLYRVFKTRWRVNSGNKYCVEFTIGYDRDTYKMWFLGTLIDNINRQSWTYTIFPVINDKDKIDSVLKTKARYSNHDSDLGTLISFMRKIGNVKNRSKEDGLKVESVMRKLGEGARLKEELGNGISDELKDIIGYIQKE